MMPNLSLTPATYINTDAELQTLADSLAHEPLLAVDTESNSLHAYRERVCLIQLSTRSADYIVDPLAVTDLSPLKPLLASPRIEKVFHAAEYDVVTMKRDFGFTFVNLFDTMLAARILGYKAFGLSNLLEMHMTVRVDKSHQRDDWGKRPLSSSSLRYAQADTHYLPALRDILCAELTAAGHLAEAQEVFEELHNLQAAPERDFDPEGYWRIGQPNLLNRNAMIVLRELYLLREELAQARDCPTFKIFANKVLVDLALAAPSRLSELRYIKGMSDSQVRRYGRHIIQAVERARVAESLPQPPRNQPPDPIISDRYMMLHSWRKERAIQRGVESDVIVSKQTLWDLAHKIPTTLEGLQEVRGLGPWRVQTYGQEILGVIEQIRTLHG